MQWALYSHHPFQERKYCHLWNALSSFSQPHPFPSPKDDWYNGSGLTGLSLKDAFASLNNRLSAIECFWLYRRIIPLRYSLVTCTFSPLNILLLRCVHEYDFPGAVFHCDVPVHPSVGRLGRFQVSVSTDCVSAHSCTQIPVRTCKFSLGHTCEEWGPWLLGNAYLQLY